MIFSTLVNALLRWLKAPAWLSEWGKRYLVPLLEIEAKKTVWTLLGGVLDGLLLLAIPVTVAEGSQALWESRYPLTTPQQQRVYEWAEVSVAVARLEDVPPVTPLVLWYKERGLQESNPDNCEGIMGLHTAVESGRYPCFPPGPIDAREVTRQLRLGARAFKEHCPEASYTTMDPEQLKWCYLYYNAGRHTHLTPDRSGYVMNGYDSQHQNMYHHTETGRVVQLKALGAWPIHLSMQTQLSHLAAVQAPRRSAPPALLFQEVIDRGSILLSNPTRLVSFPTQAAACRAPTTNDCFTTPHIADHDDFRPLINPILTPIERASHLQCSLLPGIDLEVPYVSPIVSPIKGEATRYADQWGHLAIKIENDAWIVWLAGLRSYTVSPGEVNAGQPLGFVGGLGSRTSFVHLAIFDKISTGFVDPMALLPEDSCPQTYQTLQYSKGRESKMKLTALIPLILAIIAFSWGLWLIFKKNLIEKGLLQVIVYFLGVVVVFIAVGLIADMFFPFWFKQRLDNARDSEDIEAIEDITRDLFQEAVGTNTPPAALPTVVVTATPIPFSPTMVPTSPPAGETPTATQTPSESPTDFSSTSVNLTPGPGEQVYTIQQGDRLSRIAQSYGVPMIRIQERNNINDPNSINVGQIIIIPAP